jgi:hypothetical protein
MVVSASFVVRMVAAGGSGVARGTSVIGFGGTLTLLQQKPYIDGLDWKFFIDCPSSRPLSEFLGE